MVPRSIRIRIVAYLGLTVVSLTVLFAHYMGGLQSLGLGSYEVTLRLADAGGLYPSAEVSYRGVPVGTVDALTVDGRGVAARLRIGNGYDIPSNLDAHVRSMSVIGEQYVDLVPRSAEAPGPSLRDGSVIDETRVVLPVSTADLLRSTETTLSSLPLGDLRESVDQLAVAFGGTRQDLGSLLDSSSSVVDAATENLAPTLRLLHKLQPVLETQTRSAADLGAAADHLNGFTGVLAAQDRDLRALLADGPTTFDQTSALLGDLQPSLPKVLADAETLADVLGTYSQNIASVLTVLPAVVAAIESVVPPQNLKLDVPLVNMSFKANINSPPPCTDGFPDGEHQRSTDDLSPVPPPTDSYCKVGGDDPRIVRGARNIRCPNSAKRAATAALCGLVFERFTAPNSPPSRVRIVAIDPGQDRAFTADGGTVPLDRISLTRTRPLSLRELVEPGAPQ